MIFSFIDSIRPNTLHVFQFIHCLKVCNKIIKICFTYKISRNCYIIHISLSSPQLYLLIFLPLCKLSWWNGSNVIMQWHSNVIIKRNALHLYNLIQCYTAMKIIKSMSRKLCHLVFRGIPLRSYYLTIILSLFFFNFIFIFAASTLLQILWRFTRL